MIWDFTLEKDEIDSSEFALLHSLALLQIPVVGLYLSYRSACYLGYIEHNHDFIEHSYYFVERIVIVISCGIVSRIDVL